MTVRCETSWFFGLVKTNTVVKAKQTPTDPEERFRRFEKHRQYWDSRPIQRPPYTYVLKTWRLDGPIWAEKPPFTFKEGVIFERDELNDVDFAWQVKMMYDGSYELGFTRRNEEIDLLSERNVFGTQRHFYHVPEYNRTKKQPDNTNK